jgi:DNA-binding FadR family transcriptional regulator
MAAFEHSPFAKVRISRAHENIVEQFQRLILTGKLEPGSRLPSERQLMSDFYVSRSTVREALRIAESMGLISVRPGGPSGSKVLCAPSIGVSRVLESLIAAGCASPVELIDISVLVDSSAAAMVCGRSQDHLAPVIETLRTMETTTEPRRFGLLDVEFHQAVAAASGSCLLLIVSQALTESIFVLLESRLAEIYENSRDGILSDHVAIVAALTSGNADLATSAMRKHILESYSPILLDESMRSKTAERESMLNRYRRTGLLPRYDGVEGDRRRIH